MYLSANGQLRIAHISPAKGGVANAARRLHLGLLEIGAQSHFFAPEALPDVPHAQRLPESGKIVAYADSSTRYIAKRLGLRGMMNVPSLFWSFDSFDVIHLHGADRLINLNLLPRLNQRHALIWTMHDKHLGTGGCGYPEMWGDCERWKIGCGQCPKARKEGWLIDTTALVHQRKMRIFKAIQMGIVAPNRWMMDFLEANPITQNQVLRLIPYGIDTDAFAPSPSEQARAELGLPLQGKLLLSVASKLSQRRKGMQFYPAILRRLRELYANQEIGLVLIGDNLSDEMTAEMQKIMPVYAPGMIDDPVRLAKAYSAADFFLITPTIDNFPNVILESLACGTPVASFRVGGISDMIQPGETGVMAEFGDTDSLAAQMAAVLKDGDQHRQMRLICREQAVRKYRLEVQASQYLDLYHELLRDKKAVIR